MPIKPDDALEVLLDSYEPLDPEEYRTFTVRLCGLKDARSQIEIAVSCEADIKVKKGRPLLGRPHHYKDLPSFVDSQTLEDEQTGLPDLQEEEEKECDTAIFTAKRAMTTAEGNDEVVVFGVRIASTLGHPVVVIIRSYEHIFDHRVFLFKDRVLTTVIVDASASMDQPALLSLAAIESYSFMRDQPAEPDEVDKDPHLDFYREWTSVDAVDSVRIAIPEPLDTPREFTALPDVDPNDDDAMFLAPERALRKFRRAPPLRAGFLVILLLALSIGIVTHAVDETIIPGAIDRTLRLARGDSKIPAPKPKPQAEEQTVICQPNDVLGLGVRIPRFYAKTDAQKKYHRFRTLKCTTTGTNGHKTLLHALGDYRRAPKDGTSWPQGALTFYKPKRQR